MKQGLEVAGLVHGGPVVLERTMLLDESLLVRARRLDEPAAVHTFAWDLSQTQSGDDELGRRSSGVLANARSMVLARPWRHQQAPSKSTCNKVHTVPYHEGPDLVNHVQSNVGTLGAFVVHVEAHDAKGGLTIMRRPSEPGPSHEALECPFLRNSCPKQRSS